MQDLYHEKQDQGFLIRFLSYMTGDYNYCCHIVS